MKTFIYFSQDEWRTFQAEELPVRPEIPGEFYHLPAEFPKYESEIAALKAKAIPVGNSEILEKVSLAEARIVETSVPILEWPGTVELQFKRVHPAIDKAIAILKLPDTSKPIA